MLMTEHQLNESYDVLVKEAGAQESGRVDFLYAFVARDTQEYRFMGSLGFGGKFWNSGGRVYVTMYREEETPSRLRMVDRANKKLRAKMFAWGWTS